MVRLMDRSAQFDPESTMSPMNAHGQVEISAWRSPALDRQAASARNAGLTASEHIDLTERYGAHNYSPLDVVIQRGEGALVRDVDGNRYIDCLSAYSALNQGHNHPRLVQILAEQAAQLSLTSRAFYNDQLSLMLEKIAILSGMDQVLPMNGGAEAVETAIKAMRRHGYRKRGVSEDRAEIIVAEGNFHGRTTTIISFSTDELAAADFGPYAPGFRHVPYGDAQALAAAVTENTVGVMLEPIQGEGGVIIPPADYLPRVRQICNERGILLTLDEIQTGLGRTGTLFCFCQSAVRPDVLILGKALSGGMYPVSCIAGTEEVMSVFTPGSHGSTFGGSPLAAAVACEALDILLDEQLPLRAQQLGEHILGRLRSELTHPGIREIRGRGLLLAVEFETEVAKKAVKTLKSAGVLAKDTHGTTIRFAPPLVISETLLDEAADTIIRVLNEL